jgi:hypothetical protein
MGGIRSTPEEERIHLPIYSEHLKGCDVLGDVKERYDNIKSGLKFV